MNKDGLFIFLPLSLGEVVAFSSEKAKITAYSKLIVGYMLIGVMKDSSVYIIP